jgi:hypothetical protein
MKLPYPNTAQWVVLWAAALLILTHGDLHFYATFRIGEHPARFTVGVILFAVLLAWQLSRPLSLRSPILIPVLFALGWAVWYPVHIVQVRRDAEERVREAAEMQQTLAFEELLDRLQVSHLDRPRIRTEYRAATSPDDFRRRFDAVPVPRFVKAALWEAKYGTSAPFPPSGSELVLDPADLHQ